jgi:hypothetical protein
MANYRRRLTIILSSATIFAFGAICLLFDTKAAHALGLSATFSVILACFSALSICFVYFIARRVSGFGVFLGVLAFTFLIITVDVVTSLVLNIDNAWTDAMTIAIRVLVPLSPLIAILEARKRSKAQRREQDRKSHQ